MLKLILIVLFLQVGNVHSKSKKNELKAKIFELAQLYQGKGDKDFKIQNEIKSYVDQLISQSELAPLDTRKEMLVGNWQQIWGAYEYSTDKRGVDPQIDAKALYQVIFKDGYYYNVTRLLNEETKKEKDITMLKGVYEILPGNLIRFNLRKLTKVNSLPEGKSYFDLPTLSEKKMLQDESKILPNWLVRTFLDGGFLIEVYLDNQLRVFYFFDDEDFKKPYLYIMKKVS